MSQSRLVHLSNPEIVNRADFVSRVVDNAFLEHGFKRVPKVGEAMKLEILHSILVPDHEWDQGQRSGRFHVAQAERTLNAYIKKVFSEFPPSELDERDFPDILEWMQDESDTRCEHPFDAFCQ